MDFGPKFGTSIFDQHFDFWQQFHYSILIFLGLDPGSIETFNKWKTRGENNQKLFEEIFGVLPSDSVDALPHEGYLGWFDEKTENYKKWENRYENRIEIKNPKLAIEKMKKLRGFLVKFPIEFLKAERKIIDQSFNLSIGAAQPGLLNLLFPNVYK